MPADICFSVRDIPLYITLDSLIQAVLERFHDEGDITIDRGRSTLVYCCYYPKTVQAAILHFSLRPPTALEQLRFGSTPLLNSLSVWRFSSIRTSMDSPNSTPRARRLNLSTYPFQPQGHIWSTETLIKELVLLQYLASTDIHIVPGLERPIVRDAKRCGYDTSLKRTDLNVGQWYLAMTQGWMSRVFILSLTIVVGFWRK